MTSRTRVARALVAAIALAAPGFGAACHRAPTTSCHEDAAKSIVACVDDVPITKSDVTAFVREPVWTPGSAALPDARKEALDRAIRLRLFVAEAQRRKLATPAGVPTTSPQGLAQALVQDESTRHGLSRDAVSDDDAKRWYDEHPEAFGELDDVRVQAIVVKSPRVAEEVYAKAAGADQAAFAALARTYSIDEASKAKDGDFGWLHAGPGTDRALLGLVLALRRPGAIGGPVRAGDGRWFVVRITEAPLEHMTPWGPLAKAKAKNLLAHEKLEADLDALAATLRAQAKITIFEDALAATPLAPASASASASH